MPKPKDKVHKLLVIPDLQVPYHDVRSLTAVEQVMADDDWDEVVQIGDFMDHDCISHHNVGQLRKIEGKTLFADYGVGNAILDRWQKIAKSAKITILEGNHDYRPEKLVDAQPQLRGLVETANGLNLRKRGVRWVPFWSEGELYHVGNATFIHGLYTNEHHAKKHVMRYGVNVFYGHLHDVQCFPLVLMGEDKTIVGQSLGCLCRYDQAWMQGKPSNWQQAFAAFYFFPDGYFTYEVVRIFKHRFYFRGRTYQG